VNLAQKFRTALLESDYAHLPTLGKSTTHFISIVLTCFLYILGSGLLPSMGGYLAAFFLSAAIQEDAPYFEGYFGEHQMDYPGVEQLAGTMGPYTSNDRLYVAGKMYCIRLNGYPENNFNRQLCLWCPQDAYRPCSCSPDPELPRISRSSA
jgi:hypothetical protein